MPAFEIRDMTSAEVGAACALALAQGWRDRRAFYGFALRTSTCQPLVGVVDGEIVATGVATVNGSVGWLGAVVVEEAVRGRGYGRAVTEELRRRLLAAGCETLSLVATPAGRPLYERMGFRLATHYHQMEGDHLPEQPAPPEGTRLRPIEPEDLPAVAGLDRLATAEDRQAALTELAISGGWLLEDEAGLRGFLLPSDRAYAAIVAPRFEDGLFLLDLHRHLAPPDGHARAAIPDDHTAAWRELDARGWRPTWLAPRMLQGPDVSWRPEWIWSLINSAMG
jgi:GNAT superfamily N-acetyltransferase